MRADDFNNERDGDVSESAAQMAGEGSAADRVQRCGARGVGPTETMRSATAIWKAVELYARRTLWRMLRRKEEFATRLRALNAIVESCATNSCRCGKESA